MSTMTPEQATFLLGVGLSVAKAEHPVTKSVVGAIPPERSDYRPDGILRSALDLAWHIVASETRFLAAVASGAFDFTGAARPDAVRTPAEVVAWYSERFAREVDRLQATTGDQLVKVVDFRGIFQLPAVAYLQVGLNHSIHHRGQLSTYLRPMGAKVPSIYGESYDAREAREAREKGQVKPG